MSSPGTREQGFVWDVFVSYASEDREVFVRPLIAALPKGLRVWVDFGEMQLGDSIRRKIDAGLAQSRFAVTVLSPASLDKFWTNQELDALLALEDATGTKRILPVLHAISHGEIARRSPLLAGRVAEKSDNVVRVAASIARACELAPALTLSPPRTRIYGVQRRLATFTGREDDLGRVEAVLATNDVMVSAAISGLPGIGKTALAMELAHRLAARGRFPGGIYWVNAEDPDLSFAWATEELSGAIAPDADPKERSAESVRRLSRAGADLLLILDNVVSWDASARPKPLPQGEHVHLLVTTRARDLGGARFAQLELGVLAEGDARALLARIAARDIEPGSDALLEYLAGHSLSVELAGAYLRKFVECSAKEYLAALSRGDDVESAARSRTSYERTTRQCLDALWQRLDESARRAWFLAAAFADPPVTFELSDVCGLDATARVLLRDFFLIEVQPKSVHWTMHCVVRAYGLSAPPAEEREAGERAFVRGCARFAERFELATGYQPYLVARAHVERAARADLAERWLAPAEFSEFLDRVGTALQSAGHYALARADLELALASDRKNFGDDHPSVATRRSNLGLVLRELGDLQGAKRELELALASDRKNLGDEHTNVANLRSNLGLVLRSLGHLEGARREQELALVSDLRNLGDDHTCVAVRRTNLGAVLQDLGNLKGAKREHELALASHRKNLGDDHPNVAICRSNLGMVLKDLGDLGRAKRELELALASHRKNLGDDHPNVAICRSNLGAVLKDLADLKGARREFELALASDRKNRGDAHPRVATRRSNLGTVLHDLGELEAARREFELALMIDRKNLGDEHPTVATRRCNLGAVLKDLGDLEGAKREHEQALVSTRKNLGDDHPSVAILRSNLGVVLKNLGDLERARSEGSEALRVARLQPKGSRVREGIERAWGNLPA